MTASLAAFEASRLGDFQNAGPETPQNVSYSYWPVNYLNGDPTVISNAPFPLSGVQFSVLGRGVGEMRASLQLAEPEVRSMNPWDKFIERKTGIVVVRTVTLENGQQEHTAPFHGVLWRAPADPSTGRMECIFQTVESTWARRFITGPPPIGQRDSAGNLRPGMSWTQADQFQIARDLLNPGLFSQLGNVGGQFPGWITVEGPSGTSGVLRDMSYKRGSETNLLTAHQDRSRVINGYEWYTAPRVLTGLNAYDAGSFRIQMIAGYPRLGRSYESEDIIPRFAYHADGRGNVSSIKYASNSHSVANTVWGTGSGYDDDALRVVARYPADWQYGFLVSEDKYSNPDVSNQNTLQEQTNAKLVQGYANERYIESLVVRGDLFPYFGTYNLYDDCLVTTDDWTQQGDTESERERTFVSRIMGWIVTPPEGDNSEMVEMVLSGDRES